MLVLLLFFHFIIFFFNKIYSSSTLFSRTSSSSIISRPIGLSFKTPCTSQIRSIRPKTVVIATRAVLHRLPAPEVRVLPVKTARRPAPRLSYSAPSLGAGISRNVPTSRAAPSTTELRIPAALLCTRRHSRAAPAGLRLRIRNRYGHWDVYGVGMRLWLWL